LMTRMMPGTSASLARRIMAVKQPQRVRVINRVTRDRFASALRGFGPIGLLAIAVILAGSVAGPPFAAGLVFVWAWLSRTPWREIGFSRPKRWSTTLVIGIAFGILFKLVMKAVVMPLFGAPAINPAYHYLAGNTAALPGMILAVIFGAGFGEEIFFRGYLFERLGKLFRAKAAILAITSLWFGLVHYQGQGVAGVEQAIITGLVLGGIYLAAGHLWISILAHIAFDLTAVAIIYFDVEAAVAHLLFA